MEKGVYQTIGESEARNEENYGWRHFLAAPMLRRREETTLLRLLLLVFIVLLLIGSLPTWPYSMHWGYYPSGGLGLVLFIVLILAVLDRI